MNQITPNNQNKKKKRLINVLNLYICMGVSLWIIATIIILIPYIPNFWYLINPKALESETATITAPIQNDSEEDFFPEIINNENDKVTLPEYDPDLPYTNMLIIPSIGVNGNVHENSNAHDGLENGIWRVPDYGNPEDNNTIIIAAHRFGYITWGSDFRTTNTFYNLPETEVGDQIEIIWNQRKYIYSIYKAEDSTGITDYNADLILYTCRMFNSPIRVFRYAERIE